MRIATWIALVSLVVGCGGKDPKEDCDSDELVSTYLDEDGDGFGADDTIEETCGVTEGRTTALGDCDDGEAEAFPGNLEVCDEIDNDCNGQVDDGMDIETLFADTDGDGFGDATNSVETCLSLTGFVTDDTDCDDTDGDIWPGNSEVCDTVDNDCNGRIDDDDPGLDRSTATSWFNDADLDGFGSPAASIQRCLQPSGATADNTDCNDGDADINPSATEICNGVDDNCDTLVDDDDPALDVNTQTDFYADTDGDSFGNVLSILAACAVPNGYVSDATDCDDTSNAIYPGAPETPGDDLDSDCDGLEDCQEDLDNDGHGTGVVIAGVDMFCAANGLSVLDDDCDDADPDIYPGAPVIPADGIDQDCDLADSCFEDLDGDSLGTPIVIVGDDMDCTNTLGESDDDTDCDDTSPAHWADCGVCVDPDGDDHGSQCDLGGDCDEGDVTTYDGAPEVPADGIDSDCDGMEDCFPDLDGDNWGAGAVVQNADLTCLSVGVAAADGDCDDSDIDVFPGAPTVVADGVDQDCDGVDECFEDWDGDGFGSAVEIAGDDLSCTNSIGESDIDTDCDDNAEAHWADCGLCVDGDGDDYGVQCDYGPDCDDLAFGHWSDCGLCVDLDGDDWGMLCDLGDDCDDADPLINPGEFEIEGDGFDQDCDGRDGDGLRDDFELGVADPAIWASVAGDASVQNAEVANGSWALMLGGGVGTAETVTYDTSSCRTIIWEWKGKRGPQQPDVGDNVTLSFDGGAGWSLTDVWSGDGFVDPTFVSRSGLISDPSAFWAGFRVRLVSNGSGVGMDNFFIDDFSVFCAPDDDGDGLPPPMDCDDSDIAHWSDCGLCVDADGDGFGTLCDLGEDCDDTDAGINPIAIDPVGDGIDQDCSNMDGPGFYDGFETGAPAIGVWATVSGDATIDNSFAADGTWSLNMGGDGGIAETYTIDASVCPNLAWAYMGKRGPETPDAGDGVNVEYDDGNGWVLADRWEGDGSIDPGFVQRFGVITDPAAFHAGFRVRLVSNGSGLNFDNFFIDEFLVACGSPDSDYDGVMDFLDCDIYDPAHWSDCGLCVDLDGDFYGAQCDYGEDCDDADAAINPAGIDLATDGADQDCDGIDGPPLLYDDLDSGVIDPLIWNAVSGDAGIDGTQYYSPSFSLNLGGGVGTAETVQLDTTVCANVGWAFMGKRGPEMPDNLDDLTINYWDGAGWVNTSVLPGAGIVDLSFVLQQGVITDPLAISTTFQLNLRSTGSGIGTDDFFVDNIAVGCAP